MARKINLNEKFEQIDEFWSPRVIGEINGQQVKLFKARGEFVWHHHETSDEMFLVVEGALDIELRDGVVELGPGDCYVVPRGVEHRPVARPEARAMLLEPAGTLNTGNVRNDLTVDDPEKI